MKRMTERLNHSLHKPCLGSREKNPDYSGDRCEIDRLGEERDGCIWDRGIRHSLVGTELFTYLHQRTNEWILLFVNTCHSREGSYCDRCEINTLGEDHIFAIR